jgi:transcriptional regulator PpsR
MAATGARHFASPDETVGALDAISAARLVTAVSDVALVVDESGIIRDVAMGATEQVPLESSDWVGKRWADTVTVESQPKILELLDEAETGSAGRWRQVNYAVHDGPDVPVMYSAIRINRGGAVLAVGRDLRDIAGLQRRLVQAQQAMEQDYARLRSAEMRYRLLFREIREGVVIVEAASGRIIEANPAAAQLLEHGGQDLIGRRFPIGLDEHDSETVKVMLATAESTGRADEIRVRGPGGDRDLSLSASLFRQHNTPYFLIRIGSGAGERLDPASLSRAERTNDVINALPDGFVLTDDSARIVAANQAFLDMAQIPTEKQALGEALDRWLGRPGVDVAVIAANLRRHGSIRLYTTQLNGDLGISTTIELSGVVVPEGDLQRFGFVLRNVGRRLQAGDSMIGEQMPRSVEDLTELIGQVPLKEIVRQTTDLIERLCIEAALELTNDNRASAAEMLGLSRQALYTKLRRYGVGDLEAADQSS